MSFHKPLYNRFTAGEVEFNGWFRRQLEIQAAGLNGNLDRLWPPVGNSVCLGGDFQEAECTSYWLDGYLTLTHLLKKPEMLDHAAEVLKKWFAAFPDNGQPLPDVFVPEKPAEFSTGACALCLRTLAEYHAFSGDVRALTQLEKSLRFLNDFIRKNSMTGWGKFRYFELFIPILHLLENKPQEAHWLLDFAAELCNHGFDYDQLYADFPYTGKQSQWTLDSHVVNHAMALKAATMRNFLTSAGKAPAASDEDSRKMLETLFRFHGTPYGHFNGDECLAGYAANQGSELCGVVESMFSCQWNFMLSGNTFWLDILERLAFNALPAAMSPDMWTHQYDQQVNQIGCVREEKTIWSTNANDSNLFGLEPNCGCCTANHGQGFPKLGMCAFLRSATGILSAIPLPGTLDTVIDGVPVRIAVESEYPFRNSVRYTVSCDQPVVFDFDIRIPAFAKHAEVNGNAAAPGSIHRLSRCWEKDAVISCRYDFKPRLLPHRDGLHCLQYGPLLFSLPLQYRQEQCDYSKAPWPHIFPCCDYELYRTGEWAFGFSGGEINMRELPIGEIPFSPDSPPLAAELSLAPVAWDTVPGMEHVCEALPISNRAVGPSRCCTMIPYGCTMLRMTAMPLLSTFNDN